MTTNSCLVNGLDFIDLGYAGDRWVHGDLYAVGDCWVIHCVTGKGGGASWQYPSQRKDLRDKALNEVRAGLWLAGYEFWERHGVIVLEKKLAILGKKATDHIHIGSQLSVNPDPRWMEAR